MATDKMGYRYTTKYFQNVTDSNTFIPFMLEIADIYEVNSVTIIRQRKSVNRNIRFLEQELKYIISYRMKAEQTI